MRNAAETASTSGLPLGNEFNRLQTFASLQFIVVLRYSRWHLRRSTEIYVFERASPVILFQLPSDNSIAPIHIIFVIAMGIIGFPFLFRSSTNSRTTDESEGLPLGQIVSDAPDLHVQPNGNRSIQAGRATLPGSAALTRHAFPPKAV